MNPVTLISSFVNSRENRGSNTMMSSDNDKDLQKIRSDPMVKLNLLNSSVSYTKKYDYSIQSPCMISRFDSVYLGIRS